MYRWSHIGPILTVPTIGYQYIFACIDFENSPPQMSEPEKYIFCVSIQAAKKALDTVEEFTKSQDPAFEITRFMPTGFSKVCLSSI